MKGRYGAARFGIALASGLAVFCASCSGGSVRAVDVTVTISSTVPASSSQIAVPSSTDPGSAPIVGPSDTPFTTPSSSGGSAGLPDTTSALSSTSRSTPSPTRTSPSIAAVWVSQQAADPAVPGPNHGPACPVDKQYSDEPSTGLRADVVAGWAAAQAKAAAAGVTLCLNDGKRSRAQQLAQFDEYEKQYGNQVAEQLVLPPEKSAHVAGYAVDVQPARAYRWLQNTRGTLGFCRRYDNEAWHFEYSAQYIRTGCPPRQPKPVG